MFMNPGQQRQIANTDTDSGADKISGLRNTELVSLRPICSLCVAHKKL